MMKKIKLKINKKIIFLIVIIFIVAVIIISNLSTEIEQSVENTNEISPQEEIEEKNEETTIKLYYIDSTSGILVSENQQIKISELIDKPYLKILEILINGPYENNNLINEIPKDTKINNIELKKGILKIDLSNEFLNIKGTNAIYQIVNTATEFNEVEKIKILIDGKENKNLKEYFTRKK